MADNILRFPGYLRDPERKGVWKDGEFHTSFKKRLANCRSATASEGRANYRAFELETARRGGGDAA